MSLTRQVSRHRAAQHAAHIKENGQVARLLQMQRRGVEIANRVSRG